jgi:hypothetical protein
MGLKVFEGNDALYKFHKWIEKSDTDIGMNVVTRIEVIYHKLEG